MNRTQLQALSLHLLAVETFLYRHRKELPTEEVLRLSRVNQEMQELAFQELVEDRLQQQH